MKQPARRNFRQQSSVPVSSVEPPRYRRDRGDGDERRALAPPHARMFSFSDPRWWEACDLAYREAMVRALRVAAYERSLVK